MTRSLATIVFRLTLVIGFQLGVVGVVMADLVTTVLFGAVMLPRFAALIGPYFSVDPLREAFGSACPACRMVWRSRRSPCRTATC